MPDANEHDENLSRLESVSGPPRSMPRTDGPILGPIVMPIEAIREHSEALHEEREETRAHFNSAKRTLIDQMVLYGIDETQATIQVESLIEATRNAVLLED